MLRLFEAFLESAPQLVLQLYIMAYRRIFNVESDWFTAIAAVSSLVSLAWAIVSYSKALRDLNANKGSLSWFGFGFQILWRLCMVASRVVAFVVFASVYSYYLFVAVGIHWILMSLWLISQRTKFCTDDDGGEHPIKEKLFNFIIGFIYIFCFFNTKEGMTRKRLFLYYSIMLVENSLFVSMWFPQRSLPDAVSIAAISIVWGGFVIGVLCMVLYYKFYHPSLEGTGVFFRRLEFDVEGHRVYSAVCCFCCRIQSSATSEATCGTIVNWCRRNEDPFLVAREHSNRRSPRNLQPTPGHENQSRYPPFESEFMPRQISRDFSADTTRNVSAQYSNRRSNRHDDAHGIDGVIIGPPYNFYPGTVVSCSQNVPNVVVTAASPDVLSPQDSVLVPNDRNDQEPSSDDDEVPMLVDETKIINGPAVDGPNGALFSTNVENHITDIPSSTEVHDTINMLLRDILGKEETVDEDGEDSRPINYGTLSFGKRYSIVSDCISLSSESRSSDSLHLNDERSNGSDHDIGAGVEVSDKEIVEPVLIKSGNYPTTVQDTAEIHHGDSRFNSKDMNKKPRRKTDSFNSEPTVHKLSEFVETVIDDPSSPSDTLQRNRESCTTQLNQSSLSGGVPLNIELGSREKSSSGVSNRSTSDSNVCDAITPLRRNIEFMSDEESSLHSPILENSQLKRHTFDFSEIAKERPMRKMERRRRRSKRKDYGNFVITSMKPGKFGSIRRSKERLYKIQEATEEGTGLNSRSSNPYNTEKKGNEIRTDSTTTKEFEHDSEDQEGTNSDPQIPNDMKKIKEEYARKRRLKRLLTRQLAPGKFSTVRRSYDHIPSVDDDLRLEYNHTQVPLDKAINKELEKNGITNGDSAISKMNGKSTESPDIESEDNENNLSSPVSRRHTYDFSYVSIKNKNHDSCDINGVIDVNCLVNPPSPIWKNRVPYVNYKNKRPLSIHSIYATEPVRQMLKEL